MVPAGAVAGAAAARRRCPLRGVVPARARAAEAAARAQQDPALQGAQAKVSGERGRKFGGCIVILCFEELLIFVFYLK